MLRPAVIVRTVLVAAVLMALSAPVAGADTKVTSLRPWAADNLYLVRTDLDGRTAPRLEPRASVDYLKAGQWVRISCQTSGESAYGSTVWDKVGSYYVPDHYIKTYTDGFIAGAPRCGTDTPPPPPPPPPPKPKRYVALGDSYSSGEGATSYLSGIPAAPYACHRSANAYSQLLADRHSSSVGHDRTRDFLACSGHTTADVARDQLPALARDAGVVTIGVGGNDVNFEAILRLCIVRVRGSCQKHLDRLFDLSTLRRQLDALYRRVRVRARKAVVIVVGYPRLFDGRRGCPIGLLANERRLLNDAADRLDAVLASVARVRGFRFVDPRAAFAAHGICSADRWINPFVREEGAIKGSFHPNIAGQRALADLLAATNPDVFR